MIINAYLFHKKDKGGRKLILLNCIDIPDAWYMSLVALSKHGYEYVNERGSFTGMNRVEIKEAITITIAFPYSEPYDSMLPVIPETLRIEPPVKKGYIEEYLPYLMTETIQEGEQYTYGQRIAWQIEYWVEQLKETPNTNQAIIQIACPEDAYLEHPPCLRHIGIKIRQGRLVFYPYFRSWDLWSGMPANLAGLAVVQKYMADSLSLEMGGMTAVSHGLHIYDYVREYARMRVYNKKNKMNCTCLFCQYLRASYDAL